MRGISKYATYIAPQLQWLSLTDCIDQFSQMMENQVIFYSKRMPSTILYLGYTCLYIIPGKG